VAQCKAIKASGEQCKNSAIRGGVVCAQAHGGSAPQVRLAAKRRIVTQEATALVASYPVEPIDDPAMALLTVAAEYVALKDELGRRAAELESLAVHDRHGAEQVASVLQAYMHALDSVTDCLVKINRLGLENRRVQIAEADLRRVAAAVREAVHSHEMHLTFEQGELLCRLIGQKIKEL
jgi:hypothetical protein